MGEKEEVRRRNAGRLRMRSFFFNAGFELSVEIPRLKDPAAVGKAGRSFGEIGMSYVG